MLATVPTRQRGQTIVVAAMAMVAIVGAMAIAIDAGIFLVVQRQFQAAADAGALAAAWHDPVCSGTYASEGCLTSPAAPNPLVTTLPCDPYDPSIPAPCAPCTSGYTACDVAMANANVVAQLCAGSTHTTVTYGTRLNLPARANTIVVVTQCNAGYSFGRILNLTTKTVVASSAAAIGGWSNGDIGDFPVGCTPTPTTPCLMARLID